MQHRSIPLTDNQINQSIRVYLSQRFGGLGIRRVLSLAFPAFLASAVSTLDLQVGLLRNYLPVPDDDFYICLQIWQPGRRSITSSCNSE